MDLEIVTHCWRYGRLLTYQLSSLVLYPPRQVNVTVTVFFTPEDSDTVRVLRFFETQAMPAHLRIRGWELPRERLLRRLVGRNLAAQATKADWVWFADCDYLFGEGALDAMPEQLANTDSPLVYPHVVMKSATIAQGDVAISRASGTPRLLDVNPREFQPEPVTFAFGGVQIAHGDVVRRLGYCRDSSQQQQPATRWINTVEDSAFRKILGTRGVPVELPNVFRICHSRRGTRQIGVRL